MQEDDKILKIVTRIFMAIFIVIFVTIVLKFFAKNILIDIMNIDNEFLKSFTEASSFNSKPKIDIDWSKEYPIENNNDELKENINIIEKYNEKINNIKNQIENYSSDYLIGYEKIVEIAKNYEKVIGWDLISYSDNDTPIEIGDGIWSEVRSQKNYDDIKNNIVNFNNYLKDNKIDLLYVQAPAKIENTTSGGTLNILKDYLKENTDNFINSLEENNIEVLDLREKMKEEGLDYKSSFFKTDHHWTPQTGIWATKQIANKINDLWGMKIDSNIYRKENFDTKTYENIYLGSQGRRVTLAKAKPENFDVIYPNFETNISIKIPSMEIDKTGSFREILIDENFISKDYYNATVYSTYDYGDKAVKAIKNNFVKDNEKILILKDSFADVVTPYLSLVANNIYEVDLRYFNGSIKSFIEKNNITKVIMLYYSGSLYNQKDLFEYK